jgi:hypothetical protein
MRGISVVAMVGACAARAGAVYRAQIAYSLSPRIEETF